MRILLLTGALLPQPGNNANLIGKLIPELSREHEVHILAPAFGAEEPWTLPDTVFGVPVHWVTDGKRDWKRRFLYPAIAKLTDRGGYSDMLSALVLLREIRETYHFDAVVSTMEPFPSALAASRLHGLKKVLYIMDPPGRVCGGKGTPLRNRMLPKILAKQDAILTTPFIRAALREHGLERYDRKNTSVGFPMIDSQAAGASSLIPHENGKINLLFCGWLYSDIRSPRYFLDIVSRLDERFCVYFMGKECEKLRERFDFSTRAQVVTLPQQPYQAALDAMAAADILINIGNSVPVHMPSKTLEYINTGKPMVNFYKFADCPTRFYTDRYPLCLNLFEGDGDVDAAAERFTRFCEANLGKTVARDFLEKEYSDCTPGYIAQKIIDVIGE